MGVPVTINFHPDRLVADGSETLVERLAHDRVWRSQFETGTSNGGLTAHPGGDRWHWERRMFAGRYDDAAPHERPRYGALNHRRRPAGGAVRFGSAHLRLRPHVLGRTTFCYPDSVAEPEHFAASDPTPLVALADADTASGAHDILDDSRGPGARSGLPARRRRGARPGPLLPRHPRGGRRPRARRRRRVAPRVPAARGRAGHAARGSSAASSPAPVRCTRRGSTRTVPGSSRRSRSPRGRRRSRWRPAGPGSTPSRVPCSRRWRGRPSTGRR